MKNLTKILITKEHAKECSCNKNFKVVFENGNYWFEINDHLNLTDKNYEN